MEWRCENNAFVVPPPPALSSPVLSPPPSSPIWACYHDQNLEEINVLRITLDTQIEDLEQHFETAHINYLQARIKTTNSI